MAGGTALLAGFGLTESMRQGLFVALALVALLLLAAFFVISRRWKITSALTAGLAHSIIRDGAKRVWTDQKIEELRALEDYVFDCLTRMYRGFEEQRQRIDAKNIYDVRYEELVANPVHEIGKMYAKLELGDFHSVEEKIATHAAEQKDYKPNKHHLDKEMKDKIHQRWKAYFDKYNYY